MKKQSEGNKKVCGNCRYHNTYDYPHRMFCFDKFYKRENAIVSTFDKCGEWQPKSQECFCLEDALKKKR